jgi:hypothetical protein
MTPAGVNLSRAEWHTSSHSGSNGGQCVEVARNLAAVVAVRDSKDPGQGTLVFSRAEWAAFIAALKEPYPPG